MQGAAAQLHVYKVLLCFAFGSALCACRQPPISVKANKAHTWLSLPLACRCNVTPGRSTIDICADMRVGGPLVIEAVNSGVKIPCIGGTPALFSLQSCQPRPWVVQSATQAAQSAEHKSVALGSISTDAKPAVPAAGEDSVSSGERIQGESGASFLLDVQQPHLSSAATSHAAHQTPQAWTQAAIDIVARIASNPKHPHTIAIVGSKQCGKSSFARLLVNSLLESCPSVAFLDTDCGQSEFTAPGLHHL